MTTRNGTCRPELEREYEKVNVIQDVQGASFQAKMCSLALSSTVNQIWKEKNNRIFQLIRHDGNYVISRLKEPVKDASWHWKADRNFRNRVYVKNGVCMMVP